MAIFNKKTESEADKTAEKKDAAKTSVVGSSKEFAGVILKPRVSEKSANLSNTGKYVFNVVKDTNKIEIKKAVERAYKVTVTAVNIVNVKGKSRNFGRITGRTSDFKKAVVTLKKGDKIEGATETI